MMCRKHDYLSSAGRGGVLPRWRGWAGPCLALLLVLSTLACARGGAGSDAPAGGASASPTVPADLPRVTFGPCRMALPPGFAEDQPGSGYYPESNRLGFAALDALDAPSLDAAAETRGKDLQTVVMGYQETRVTKAQDSYRVDFTGAIDGRPGAGTSHVSRAGPTACAITLFLLQGSPVDAEAALGAMTASLQAVAVTPTAAAAAARTPTVAPVPEGWQLYRGEQVPVDAAYPPGWNVLNEEQVQQATGRQVTMPLVSFTPPWDPIGYSGVTITYSPTIPAAYRGNPTRLAADSLAAVRQEACPADPAAEVTGPRERHISGTRFSRYDLRCTVRGEVMTLSYLVAFPGTRAWIVTLGGRGTVQDPDYTDYLFPILDTVRLR